MIIQDRCRIHAAKADNMGMYTTANVLTHAAQAIEILTKQVERLEKALDERVASKVIKTMTDLLKACSDKPKGKASQTA